MGLFGQFYSFKMSRKYYYNFTKCLKYVYIFQNKYIKYLVVDSLSTTIEKLMYWQAGSWVRHEQKGTCVLRVLYDQLLITADTKIIESLNMNGRIKGFFKDNVLIFAIFNEKGVRKIKFMIKGDVSQCLEVLSRHFPVVNQGALSKNTMARYRNLDEVLKGAIETMERQGEIYFFFTAGRILFVLSVKSCGRSVGE